MKNTKRLYLYIFSFLIILLLVLSLCNWDIDAKVYSTIPKIQLRSEGFCVGSGLFSGPDVNTMNQHVKRKNYKHLQRKIQENTGFTRFMKTHVGPQYELQDYIYG